MSDTRHLIRREIKARREFITGKVLTPMNVLFFGPGSTSTVWVVDVDIGDPLRRLQDVPIKMVNNNRLYASLGASVLLRRNTAGRYDIVGPADVATGTTTKKTYTIDVPTAAASVDLGFDFRVEVFTYYGDNSLWADGVTVFPKVTVIDPDGIPIT